uniref:Kinesin-related protein 11-like isoform X2 n=1 Tax=Rhizophora mucronata TaxID=61149 RepID=A0A2P2M328_RHIMU
MIDLLGLQKQKTESPDFHFLQARHPPAEHQAYHPHQLSDCGNVQKHHSDILELCSLLKLV